MKSSLNYIVRVCLKEQERKKYEREAKKVNWPKPHTLEMMGLRSKWGFWSLDSTFLATVNRDQSISWPFLQGLLLRPMLESFLQLSISLPLLLGWY